MINVVHVHRRPIIGLNYSAEGHFAAVRGALDHDVTVRVHIVPFNSTGVLRRIGSILDVARQRGDVVHITGDIHFVALGLRRKRTLLTVLDCGLANSPSRAQRILYRALWLRGPIRRSARVVAISEFTAEQLVEHAGIARDQIDIVPVTIDDQFVPRPPRPWPDRPTVLCVGTTPNKNLQRVAAALSGLSVKVHVLGPLNDELAAAFTSAGVPVSVSVGLPAHAVRDLYAEADLVLFPSTYEGFGMPIVEAQATGRPVVTSDRAPMDEVAGGAACLVDPESVASIRAGVERVLTDAAYRAELVEAGFKNRERFRPRVAGEAYSRLYREMTT